MLPFCLREAHLCSKNYKKIWYQKGHIHIFVFTICNPPNEYKIQGCETKEHKISHQQNLFILSFFLLQVAVFLEQMRSQRLIVSLQYRENRTLFLRGNNLLMNQNEIRRSGRGLIIHCISLMNASILLFACCAGVIFYLKSGHFHIVLLKQKSTNKQVNIITHTSIPNTMYHNLL